jgi:hypothetical protein
VETVRDSIAAWRKPIPIKGINMSELQSDDIEYENEDLAQESEQEYEIEGEEAEESEDDSESADLATDSEDEHEQNDKPSKDEAIQKVINKKTFEAKEAQRKVEALEAKLREIEARQVVAEPPMPVLPEFASQEEVQQFQREFSARKEWEFNQAQLQRDKQAREQEVFNAKQQQLSERATEYGKRAKDLGVSQSELQKSAEIVANIGMSEDLMMEILEDKQGALITKYLANNIEELETLNSLSAFKQARYIAEKIRPKLVVTKKTTNTPPPPVRASGKGGKLSVYDKALNGMTFE